MITLPDSESARMRALHDLAILDTAEEEAFDRITRIAAALMRVPIALVSLVDSDRQWFKSKVGLDVCETPRGESFCAHSLGKPVPLVVEDAQSDPRFSDNPLVQGPPHIRFYAGVQLRTSEGLDLGALCVIDSQPRPPPSAEELSLLSDLAATTTLLIEQRKLVLDHATESDRRRLAEAAARVAREEAEAANTAMRDFFSRMSHDLRTPLGAILGFAEFLREDDLQEGHKQDVEEIYLAGKKMLALVDDLLIESRKTPELQ